MTPLVAVSRLVGPGPAAAARLLLDAAPSAATTPDACGRTALFFAVRAGNLELLHVLLAATGVRFQHEHALDKTLAELCALRPSVGADVAAALRKGSLLK